MTNHPNSATELAKERNRAAGERTLMAWIRTSLALISFGFGIDSIVSLLNQALGGTLNPWRTSRILGLGFVGLGIFAMLYAAIDHQRRTRSLERNELRYVSRFSPTLVVAYILAGLGGIAFFSMSVSQFLK